MFGVRGCDRALELGDMPLSSKAVTRYRTPKRRLRRFALLDFAGRSAFAFVMKNKSLIQFAPVALVAAILIAGCSKEQPAAAPAPAPAPKVEAAPAPAPVAEVPKVETPKAKTGGTIDAKDAKAHVGETATVTGKVGRVTVSKKGDIFMDIGGVKPNAPFVAVCFGGAIPADDLRKYVGKNIAVTGLIEDYNGQAEIKLQSVGQVVGVTE
ncbi:MAG: hypothetical protein RLZZ350_1290 [Verrucomicrobiota bacterium]